MISKCNGCPSGPRSRDDAERPLEYVAVCWHVLPGAGLAAPNQLRARLDTRIAMNPESPAIKQSTSPAVR